MVREKREQSRTQWTHPNTPGIGVPRGQGGPHPHPHVPKSCGPFSCCHPVATSLNCTRAPAYSTGHGHQGSSSKEHQYGDRHFIYKDKNKPRCPQSVPAEPRPKGAEPQPGDTPAQAAKLGDKKVTGLVERGGRRGHGAAHPHHPQRNPAFIKTPFIPNIKRLQVFFLSSSMNQPKYFTFSLENNFSL